MNNKSYLPNIIAGATGAVIASAFPVFLNTTRAETKLLPFQGRLTDAAGISISDGSKIVEFKMYDAPAGGTVKWSGEVHRLSVNGGLVNTMLGSKASLGSVDFSTPTYLQITVDAQTTGPGSDLIDSADPPLLPRQRVLPTVYASVAGEIQYTSDAGLATVKGSELFDANGKIKALAIASNKAITGAQLAENCITGSELRLSSVTTEKLAEDVLRRLVPPGTIVAYGGSVDFNEVENVPSGWLICDGSALRSTQPEYEALFARIRTNWGDGTSSATGAKAPAVASGVDKSDFNLPDLRGCFLRGVAGSSGRDPDSASSVNSGTDGLRYSLLTGGKSGNAVGSFQNDAFRSHTHPISGSISGANGNLWANGDSGVKYSPGSVPFNAGGYVSLSLSIENSGGKETRPKNANIYYIIKL